MTIMPIQTNIWSATCVKFISIFLSLGLEMEDADCASTLTDIDTHIPKIDSRNMLKGLI